MNVIKGKNQIIELLISGTFYPIFCCKSFEYAPKQEVVEVTSVNSAFAREYVPGMAVGTLNISGVTTLDNSAGTVSVFYMMQESVRRQIQTLRMRMTDDDGGTLQIQFTAIITGNTVSREHGTYSQSVSDFIITGVPVFSAVIPGTGSIGGGGGGGGSMSGGGSANIQLPLYIDVVAGESSVHDSLLEVAGVVILEVDRSGIQFNQVVGSPGNQEFSFGGVGDGTISFDPTNPFNAGEVIYILYTSP